MHRVEASTSILAGLKQTVIDAASFSEFQWEFNARLALCIDYARPEGKQLTGVVLCKIRSLGR